MDNRDTLKNDKLETEYQNRSSEAVRNTYKVEFLIQNCCIMSLNTVNVMKNRFTSLVSTQDDKPHNY